MSVVKVKLKVFSCVGAVSLIIGFLIYLIFRDNTYIAQIFSDFQIVIFLREVFKNIECDFIKYYLADYLWAVALSCGLHIIFIPKAKGSLLCTLTVFMFGSIFEIMQLTKFISGTGDLIDILLYLLAGLSVNLLNQKGEKRNEKNC